MVRVIVVVEGGLVQSIYADNPDELSIDVIDYDEVNDPSSQEYNDNAETLKQEIKDKDMMSIVY